MILRIKGNAELSAEVELKGDGTMEIHDIFCTDVSFEVPSDGYVDEVGGDVHQVEGDEPQQLDFGLSTIRDYDVSVDFRLFVPTIDPRQDTHA